MPRPPRAKSGEVASKVITARVTPAEYEQAQKIKGEQSWSHWFRREILGKDVAAPSRPPVPEVNRQLYLELGRIGNNLNQQAKACHIALQQGQSLPVNPETIAAVADKVNQVRLALLGASSLEPDDAEPDNDDW